MADHSHQPKKNDIDSSSIKSQKNGLEDDISTLAQPAEQVSSFLQIGSASNGKKAPVNPNTILSMQTVLGNSATNQLVNGNGAKVQRKKTPSTPFSNFGLQTATEFAETEELQPETDEAVAPEIKQITDTPSDTPPTNPSDNGTNENNTQQSPSISPSPINEPIVQRGFMSSIKKGASSVGKGITKGAKSVGKGLAKGAKGIVGGLQGGLIGAAKVLLGPFWDLIVQVRDKKDGKEVSYMGKDNDKYMDMLKDGKDNPYGEGGSSKFATGLSWVANVLLGKIASWTGWAALIAGILGIAGPALGAAPLVALLGVSEILAQVATVATLAKAGINAVLAIFSAIRANKLYKLLPEIILGTDSDNVKKRGQYLVSVREFGSNITGVAEGASEAAMAGLGGAAKGTKKGTKSANKFKSKNLQADELGKRKGAIKSLKDKYNIKKNVKSGGKATIGDYSGKAVRTSKAESQLASKIKGKQDEIADAMAQGKKQSEMDELFKDYNQLKADHKSVYGTPDGKQFTATTKAGSDRARTLDDYKGEIMINEGIRFGTGAGKGAQKGAMNSINKDDAESWDGQWGDSAWGAENTKSEKEESEYKKKDLPKVGEKALAGVVNGFLPFTLLLSLWRVLYRVWTQIAKAQKMMYEGLKKFTKPLRIVGAPIGKVIGWIQSAFAKFGGMVTSTHEVLDSVDKGGEKLKEDAKPEA